MELTEVWPLFGLRLRTPRLQLAPVRDADLPELVEAAVAGVVDEDLAGHGMAWPIGTPDEVRRRVVQYQWRQRADLTPASWAVQLGVRFEGRIVGVQDVVATEFATSRAVTTGSWLTRDAQGRGVGTEMRAAVLLFVFDVLGAEVAMSGFIEGNAPSAGISRRLGYRHNGRERLVVEGTMLEEQRLRLERDELVRPDWALGVEGWTDAARHDLLGADAVG